jgi:hypothetical protein
MSLWHRRGMYVTGHNQPFHNRMKNFIGQDKKCSNFKHISYEEAQTFEEVCGLFQQWEKKEESLVQPQ